LGRQRQEVEGGGICGMDFERARCATLLASYRAYLLTKANPPKGGDAKLRD